MADMICNLERIGTVRGGCDDDDDANTKDEEREDYEEDFGGCTARRRNRILRHWISFCRS